MFMTYSYINVNDIPIFQETVIRDSVADHIIHRSANRFREILIVQRWRIRPVGNNKFMNEQV